MPPPVWTFTSLKGGYTRVKLRPIMKEIYYWIYKALYFINPKGEAAFSALIAFMFLFFMNIICIVRWYYHIKKFSASKESALFVGLFLFIIVLIWGYLKLYRKRVEIFSEINAFTSKEKNISKIKFSLYTIFTLLTFYLTLIFS